MAGRPFIDYQIELLRRNGVDDLVICVGFLGEAIERHLGDGEGLGVRIRYSQDGPEQLGPAGALKRAEGMVDEDFFVTYGDAYLRAPYRELMDSLAASGRLGLMAVFKNDGKFGRSDNEVEGGIVVRYDKGAKPGELAWINFGVTALSRRALKLIPSGMACAEDEFYNELIERRQLGAFEVRDRFYEIGTPASLAEFERFMASQS